MHPLIGAIVIATCVALVGIPLAKRGLHLRRRARTLVDTKTSCIADLGAGLREVRGRILPLDAPLVSPLGQRECVYFSFRIDEKVTQMKRGKIKTKWRTILSESMGRPCIIDDGTGRAEIALGGAELDLDVDQFTRSGFLNDAPAHVEALLQDHGKTSVGVLLNKSMRYEETVLAPGDELYVLGEAGQGTAGLPLFAKALVSDRGEASLVRRYRLRALGWFGGAALMVAAAAGIVAFQLTRS